MDIAAFTFNPFQENTYILSDESLECIIIDPGCNSFREQNTLRDYISGKGLKPVRLINTHCHIDHVLGNAFVAETYQLELEIHRGELETLIQCPLVAKMYGISYEVSPHPTRFLEEHDQIAFGKTTLGIILTPGHSPASISLYNAEEAILIAGDVLFYESIGRTDLPGGDYTTLITSIKDKLFILDDDVKVFPGHGEMTTIGHERVNNPFLK